MGSNRRRAAWISALSGVLVVTLFSGSALAHDIIFLRERSKMVIEGSVTNFGVARCCHGSGAASVAWQTLDGSALSGSDYVQDSGTLAFPSPIPPDETITFRTTAVDGLAEPVMIAHIELSDPQGNPSPFITSPRIADVVIVDIDGPSRVAFAYPEYSVYSNRDFVTLDVVRLGTAAAIDSALEVAYETADGTALAGEHYKQKSGSIEFEAGERRSTAPIKIPILSNFDETSNTEFTVSLDVPEDPTAGPSEVSVEIRNLQTGDYAKPFTDFHRPKDGATYDPTSYFTKEAHVFFDDGDGSGVKTLALALAKKMKSGGCKWWNGKGYRRSSCKIGKAQKNIGIWAMRKHPGLKSGDFKVFRYPHRLKPTVGTKVRAYRVISRATDFSGNVESRFTKGFNIRTFRVRN